MYVVSVVVLSARIVSTYCQHVVSVVRLSAHVCGGGQTALGRDVLKRKEVHELRGQHYRRPRWVNVRAVKRHDIWVE